MAADESNDSSSDCVATQEVKEEKQTGPEKPEKNQNICRLFHKIAECVRDDLTIKLLFSKNIQVIILIIIIFFF